ncbi:unnamed protein product, partial [Prunus brigantina]
KKKNKRPRSLWRRTSSGKLRAEMRTRISVLGSLVKPKTGNPNLAGRVIIVPTVENHRHFHF